MILFLSSVRIFRFRRYPILAGMFSIKLPAKTYRNRKRKHHYQADIIEKERKGELLLANTHLLIKLISTKENASKSLHVHNGTYFLGNPNCKIKKEELTLLKRNTSMQTSKILKQLMHFHSRSSY